MPLTHLSCLYPYRTPNGDLVGCGRCLACRVKKRRDWCIRNQLELDSWNQKGLFVTLTYSNANLPLNIYGKPTLRPSDLTNFFKRLRKALSKQNRKIRYFACGEYGTKTARSHYHAIIYGVDENDSELIHKCWGLDGFDTWLFKRDFGWIEPDSIQYVCGYVTKKWTSKSDKKKFELENRVPPFQRSSQGLGLEAFARRKDVVLESGGIAFKGRLVGVPKYFVEKFPELEMVNEEFSDLAQKLTLEELHVISNEALQKGRKNFNSLSAGTKRKIIDDYKARLVVDIEKAEIADSYFMRGKDL